MQALDGESLFCTEQKFLARANRTDVDKVPVIRDTYLVLGIIGIIYTVISFVRFLYYRNTSQWLLKRRTALIFLSSCGTILFMVGPCFSAVFFISCFYNIAISMLVLPFLLLQLPLKVVYAYNALNFYDVALNADLGLFSDNDHQSTQKKHHHIRLAAYLCRNLWCLRRSRQVEIAALTPEDALLLLEQKKFYTSFSFRMITFTLFLIPLISAILADLFTSPHLNQKEKCVHCNTSLREALILLIYGAVSISIALVTYLQIRKRLNSDPFGMIKETLVSLFTCGSVVGLGFLLYTLYPDNPGMPYFSFNYITWFGIMVFQFIATDLQIFISRTKSKESFLTSSSSSSRSREMNLAKKNLNAIMIVPESPSSRSRPNTTPNVEPLIQTLRNPEKLLKFEAYLASEYSVELTRMYTACEAFRTAFADLPAKTQLIRAKKIFSLYVDEGAILQVNLSYSIRIQVKQELDKEHPSANMYDLCIQEVLSMLRGPYLRYNKTQLLLMPETTTITP